MRKIYKVQIGNQAGTRERFNVLRRRKMLFTYGIIRIVQFMALMSLELLLMGSFVQLETVFF